MKHIYLALIAILIIGCMAKPRQPPLTEKEVAFFKKQSKYCTCPVSREIDPRNIKLTPNAKKSYAFTFDSLNLDQFNNIDSMKVNSFSVARELHNKVLQNSFNYPYDSILVIYRAFIDKENVKEEDFKYGIEELK